MAIGDDIFTILGMVPIRDRAGIQRGTMADEAVKASQPPPQPPPQVQLPPMGGPQPQADVQLPDDVPTAYAAGKAKQALPVPAPTERVVASSPAANPSPAVRRGSDVILAEMERRKRMEDMNGLLASIGLVASSLRGGGADSGSRNALVEQAFGGGKAMSVAEMIALNNLRSSEDASAAQLAARQRAIDYATKTDKLKPEDAAALHDMGVLADRYKPSELRERGKIQTDEEIRRQLEPQIDAYAAATGSDPNVLRAQLKKDPQKVLEIMSPQTRASVRKTEAEATGVELDSFAKAQKYKAWHDAVTNPEVAQRLGLTPADVEKYRNPEAFNEFTTKFGAKSGEIAAGRGEATRGKVVDEYIKTDMPKVSKASNYLQTAIQLGDIWNDKAITGTLSGPIQSIARAYSTFSGTPMPNLNDATAMTSLLQAGALDTLRALGGHDSDRDYERAMAIQGSTDMQAHEARGLHILNEKRARLDLQQANEKRDRYAAQNPQLKEEFDNLPRIPLPEPSKLLQADIYEPEERHKDRNAQLRTTLTQYAEQVRANPTPETISHYQKVAQRFDREYGPGLSGWYILNERKRAAAGGANGTAP